MSYNYWDRYRLKQKGFVAKGGNVDSFTGYELMELWEYIPKDEQGSYDLLFKAMNKGNIQAACRCMSAAVHGHPFEKDGKCLNAVDICKLGAAIGDSSCEYNMGMLLGQQGNYEEALAYYRKSAENGVGNANGMSRVAKFYTYGTGVAECPEIAAYWVFYKPHGNEVDPDTQNELMETANVLAEKLDYIKVVDGQIRFNPRDVLTKAAEAGERDAWVALGYNEKDISKQKEYFYKAAELGSPGGQMLYAVLCQEEGDEDSFVKYAQMASEQGCAPAQQDYADYLLKKGNVSEAKKWLEAIVNHSSMSLHDIETWAFNELAYIFYQEGNKERALFCWHSTDGEYAPRNTVDWNGLAKELYPGISVNSQDKVGQSNNGDAGEAGQAIRANEERNNGGAGNGGCMVLIVAVITCAIGCILAIV